MRAVTAGAVAALVALVPAQCSGGDDPNLLDVDAGDFPAWSTMARLAEVGSITVGITGDQVDADGAPEGFEVEVAQMVAGALGIPDHDIRWVEVEHDHRERLIEDRLADIVVAALPLKGPGDEIVGSAGPYHVGEHRLLVPHGTADIAGTTVCAAYDTPDDAVQRLADTDVAKASATACVERLHAGAVDAVYGPDLALTGSLNGHFTLLDEPRFEQPYGIGVAKADDGFREFIDEVVETAIEDGRWVTAWESSAGAVLGPSDPPALG